MWPQQYFERDLTFVGLAAMENTLQWQAPETIQMMRDAGVKVWISTGDKYETTLGVAKACDLAGGTI